MGVHHVWRILVVVGSLLVFLATAVVTALTVLPQVNGAPLYKSYHVVYMYIQYYMYMAQTYVHVHKTIGGGCVVCRACMINVWYDFGRDDLIVHIHE